MQALILFLASSVVFLILDAVMLTNVMRPLFERHLGDGLAADFRLAPAAAFYLIYMMGLMWFVALPALRAGDGLGHVFLGGALLGLMCYGTYEFTSFAVMRDWHWHMAAVDTLWGGLLTGITASAGVAAARQFG